MSSSPNDSEQIKCCPVFWFTGLSGAGKTTIAVSVSIELTARRLIVIILDGDEVRQRRAEPLGYSKPDILTNNAEIAALCQAERNNADVIFVPIISPYAEGRANARKLIGPGFFESYVSADKDSVTERDVKGMYAKAAKGEIPAMIGFAPEAPYEPPLSPDLILDSTAESPARSARKLTRFVLANLNPTN